MIRINGLLEICIFSSTQLELNILIQLPRYFTKEKYQFQQEISRASDPLFSKISPLHLQLLNNPVIILESLIVQ